MKKKYLYLTLAAASLLLTLLAAWFFTHYKRVAFEQNLPPRGEARFNPLYALKLTLRARGVEASSRRDLDFAALKLKPGDLLLLDTDVRSLSEAQATQLLDWVEGGGQLLLRLPEDEEGRPGELLWRLGVAVHEHPSCQDWSEDLAEAGDAKDKKTPRDFSEMMREMRDLLSGNFGNDTKGKGRFCTRMRFTTSDEYESDFAWLWGNPADGFIFGRHPWGEGAVLISADFDMLHNAYLESPGHSALAWQLLGPALAGEGRAFLIYAAEVPPLWVLLLREGWPALLPLLLALLGWLWARSQRLGPLLPLAPPHQRALQDHLKAAGEFVFGRGRAAALHAAVLRAFQQRLRRRDPVTAALSGEALVQALSEQYHIAAQRIRQALNPQELARPEQFYAAIRTLMQLRANP
jgi:Domain of unknown function (DUF4350)